jgi:spore coat polysaccharide biosynthesis protein SpsF
MIAIIQSRMSSVRLPGKALRLIGNKSLLSHVITRVKTAKLVSRVIVATSDAVEDDDIQLFCLENGIECFRGSLEDVAFRLSMAAMSVNADSFLRINGDSPLIDPGIIDKAISLYCSGEYDLVTNVQYRTFPKGQSVEAIRLDSLLKMYRLIDSAFHKEHVTTAFYENSESFNILNFIKDGDPASEIQLSVDTAEDFLLIEAILKRVNQETSNYQEIINAYHNMMNSDL